MERSSKHGPRIDEEIKKDSASLSSDPRESREEYRRAEGLTEEDLSHGAAPAPDSSQDEAVLSDDEAEARSEIARFINPSVFPARSAEIRESAESNNAPTAVVQALDRLPDGQTFENFQAVWEALGGRPEKRF